MKTIENLICTRFAWNYSLMKLNVSPISCHNANKKQTNLFLSEFLPFFAQKQHNLSGKKEWNRIKNIVNSYFIWSALNRSKVFVIIESVQDENIQYFNTDSDLNENIFDMKSMWSSRAIRQEKIEWFLAEKCKLIDSITAITTTTGRMEKRWIWRYGLKVRIESTWKSWIEV